VELHTPNLLRGASDLPRYHHESRPNDLTPTQQRGLDLLDHQHWHLAEDLQRPFNHWPWMTDPGSDVGDHAVVLESIPEDHGRQDVLPGMDSVSMLSVGVATAAGSQTTP